MAGSSRARDGAAGRAKQPLGAIRDDAPRHIATLAAEHVKDMIAMADKSRRAQHARRARTMADFGERSRPDLLPTPFRLERPSAQEPTATDPTASPHISAVDTGQPQEPALAAHRHAPTGSVPC